MQKQNNLNRVKNTGLIRKPIFLTLEQSNHLRNKIDRYIDQKIEEWNRTVPYAQNFEEGDVNKTYYVRHLIETALRIRLLRVAETKALSEIAKQSPEAAKIWANYEMEEMVHDTLFMNDLKSITEDADEIIRTTEPFFATKLLSGFFNYLLDHEGPLGVVAYSYLVEYVNVKLDPLKNKGLKNTFDENHLQGQLAHTHTDDIEDHPGEVWDCLRLLISSDGDVENLYRYIDEHQRLLAMYFQEIYSEIFVEREAA